MTKTADEFRQAVCRIVESINRSGSVLQGVVTEVDETEFTCTVKVDDAVDYFDVRLRGLVKGELQGFAFIPKMDSVVLCSLIGANELYVSMFTEIDKVIFTDNDLELILDTEKIDIKKGDNIKVHIDKDSLSVTNDKVKVLQEGTEFTLTAGTTTVKASVAGVTIKRGASGLKKTLDDLLSAIQRLTVTTPMGPSSPPINIAEFVKIQLDLINYLEG